MHPTKTKIVFCKDSNRKSSYPNVMFDFLGYCFRPRSAENPRNAIVFCSFLPAVSPSALTSMRETIRDLDVRRRTHVSLDDIARQLNPLLRGWIGYYGRYRPSAMGPILRYVNQTLQAWLIRKFKRLKGHKTKAGLLLERLARECPGLFVHWRHDRSSAFA
jgi:RNA-directed DNA polymerase